MCPAALISGPRPYARWLPWAWSPSPATTHRGHPGASKALLRCPFPGAALTPIPCPRSPDPDPSLFLPGKLTTRHTT